MSETRTCSQQRPHFAHLFVVGRTAYQCPGRTCDAVSAAAPRTAEQSHLVALAERDDLAARLEATEARLAEAERLLRVFADDQCWVPEGHKTCFNHDEPGTTAETCPNRLTREFLRGVDQ